MCGSVLALAAGLMVSPAFAQDSEPAPANDQTTAPAQDIIVTARRVAERLQDIPVAVTAVTGDGLKNMSIRELRDLSGIAPNLNIKNSSNDGQASLVALRGQIPAGILLTTDSAVGIYVDGYNNPRAIGFRGALVDIARIEVLRGPQGTLYGRNTTGGAISVVTNSPEDKWAGLAHMKLGNYGTGEFDGMINIPLTDELAVRLVGQRGVHNGYGHDFDGRDLSDEDSTYLRGKVKYKTGGFSAELYGDYQSNFTGGPIYRTSNYIRFAQPGAVPEIARELGLPLDSNGYALALTELQKYIYTRGATSRDDAYRSGERGSYSNFNGWSAGADLKLELTDQLSLRSLTAYRHAKRRNGQDIDGTPYDIIYSSYRIDDDFYSEEFQLLGNFNRLSFVAGVFWSLEDGFETSAPAVLRLTTAAAGRPYASTQGGFVKSESLAAFAQANYKITDTLTLTGGIRYTKDIKKLVTVAHVNQNYINLPLPAGIMIGCNVPTAVLDSPTSCRGSLSNSYSDPSWLASVDWKITSDILTYAKVARGFRAGGQNLRGITLGALTPFGPETITEYEVGLKSDLFNRMVRFNLALFHDDYSGVQRTVTQFILGQSNSLVTNAAQAKIDGVEVEAAIHPTNRLTFSANVAYLNARYVTFVDFTGDRSKEDWPTPAWTYALTARYTAPVGPGDFSIQADFQGQSSQNLYPAAVRQPQDVTQPAYGLLNGRLTYNLPNLGLEVAVYGRNLLDKVYAEGGLANEAGIGLNYLNIGEPRTFGLELTKTF
jgi:iron complex outermembrane receptor protein